MKRNLLSIAAVFTALLYCLGFAAPALVSAASSAPGSGEALEISPPLVTLSVNPGQTVTLPINLRDVSGGDLVVTGEANDFVAAGEDGTPKILLDGQDSGNPFSMKSWVAPLPELTLAPQQIKKMQVTINVPRNAAPGGHYGVIRFTAAPPELKGTGVSLSASLGSLILLTVKGPIKESLSIADFGVYQVTAKKNGPTIEKKSSIFQSGPVTFEERIKNEGNIHEEPTGKVLVKNMFGKPLATVSVNMPVRNILPASTRKFEQPLDQTVIGTKKLFGRYTATLTLTYGAGKQTLTKTVAFWVIPYKLVAGVIVALVGGFFLLRFLLRHYNQRVISKAQGGTRAAKRKGRKKQK